MKKIIPFAKIEATGNDFIILDDREIAAALLSPEMIKNWCDRHFGIGADGLIHVSVSGQTAPRMLFFNADGSRGAMCGNGLRAVALHLLTIGVCHKKHDNFIEADDGLHRFTVDEQGRISVELLLNEQNGKRIDAAALDLPAGIELLGLKQVGVPHLVLKTELDEFADFEKLGRRLRSHPLFGAQGTNVNLIRMVDENTIKVRTYERGVEGETFSCGTGVTACALLCWECFSPSQKTLTVQTRGGILKVEQKNSRLWLGGPAHIVFIGQKILEN
ncbi:diaminopimelate epimerase [Calditrichota bacterium GD2]